MAEITVISELAVPTAAHRPTARVRRSPGCVEPAEDTLEAACPPPHLPHRTDAQRP